MSKYTEWEIRLKEHFANMKHEVLPEHAQGMLDLLDRELPVRKRKGFLWFTRLFAIGSLVAIAFTFYTINEGRQPVVTAENDLLLEAQEVVEAKKDVFKAHERITVQDKLNNPDGLAITEESNRPWQEYSNSASGYKQEVPQRHTSRGYAIEADSAILNANTKIQTDKSRLHFAAAGRGALHAESNVSERSIVAPDRKEDLKYSAELTDEIQATNNAEKTKSEFSLSFPTLANTADFSGSALKTDSIAKAGEGSSVNDIGDSMSKPLDTFTQVKGGQMVLKPDEERSSRHELSGIDSLHQLNGILEQHGANQRSLSLSIQPDATDSSGNEMKTSGLKTDSIAEAEEDSLVNDQVDSMIAVLDSSTNKKDEQVSLKSAKKRLVQYELSAVGGLYQLNRTLEQEGADAVLHFRRDNEQPIMAQAGGITLNMVIKDHYLLSSGLNSLSLTETTNYPQLDFPVYEQYLEEEINRYKEIDFIDSFYVELNNERLLVIDTQYINKVETTYVQHTDTQITSYSFEKERIKVDYVSIPLQAGYRFYAGQRFSVDLYGGVGLNFLRSVQGSYWALASDTAYKLPSEHFNKFILSSSLGITTSYRIRKGLVLDLGTRFSYLPNVSVPGSGTVQRYQLKGIQLGLSYRF